MHHVSRYQWVVIILFFTILLFWLLALTKKSEKAWTNNPWFPTMTVALLWGVWNEQPNYTYSYTETN